MPLLYYRKKKISEILKKENCSLRVNYKSGCFIKKINPEFVIPSNNYHQYLKKKYTYQHVDVLYRTFKDL